MSNFNSTDSLVLNIIRNGYKFLGSEVVPHESGSNVTLHHLNWGLEGFLEVQGFETENDDFLMLYHIDEYGEDEMGLTDYRTYFHAKKLTEIDEEAILEVDRLMIEVMEHFDLTPFKLN